MSKADHSPTSYADVNSVASWCSAYAYDPFTPTLYGAPHDAAYCQTHLMECLCVATSNNTTSKRV